MTSKQEQIRVERLLKGICLHQGVTVQEVSLEFQDFLLLMREWQDERDEHRFHRERDAAQKSGFASEEVAQLREIFGRYDSDGEGLLSGVAVEKMIQKSGFASEEVAQLMEIF